MKFNFVHPKRRGWMDTAGHCLVTCSCCLCPFPKQFNSLLSVHGTLFDTFLNRSASCLWTTTSSAAVINVPDSGPRCQLIQGDPGFIYLYFVVNSKFSNWIHKINERPNCMDINDPEAGVVSIIDPNSSLPFAQARLFGLYAIWSRFPCVQLFARPRPVVLLLLFLLWHFQLNSIKLDQRWAEQRT